MATNKLALLRYNTIDKCLTNRRRKWTLEDLIDKVADALYQYEGITTGIGKRTIQADIHTMRSDKLGYNAPIIVVDRKYYTYEDANFSIHQVPVSDVDMQKMKDAVQLLKQLSGFEHLEGMSEVVARLEYTVASHMQQEKTVIQLEQNALLKGLNWINLLSYTIKEEVPILLSYQSFKSRQPQSSIFYPYLLKEYRNRWFLIGRVKGNHYLQTRALDRIVAIEEMAKKDFVQCDIDLKAYFDACIGVTRSENDRLTKVIFEVESDHADYVKTKPLHHSQEVLTINDAYTTFSIMVIMNFELQKELLSFGEYLKVVAPRHLVKMIQKRADAMRDMYQVKE